MGFLSLVLGMLVGGYGLGIWTAGSVFREGQRAYEDGNLEQVPPTSLTPIPGVAWSTMEPGR